MIDLFNHFFLSHWLFGPSLAYFPVASAPRGRMPVLHVSLGFFSNKPDSASATLLGSEATGLAIKFAQPHLSLSFSKLSLPIGGLLFYYVLVRHGKISRRLCPAQNSLPRTTPTCVQNIWTAWNASGWCHVQLQASIVPFTWHEFISNPLELK